MSDTLEPKKRGRPPVKKEESTLENLAAKQDKASSPVVEETVTVKKASLDSVLQKMQDLEARVASYDKMMSGVTTIQRGEWQETPQRTLERTAMVKKWQADTDSPWQYIIDWKFVRRERFENDFVDIYRMTIMDEQGNRSQKEFTLSQWAKISTFDIVKMSNLQEKIYERKVGDTRQVSYVSDSSRISGLRPEVGRKVDMKVTRAERFWTIEFPNGLKMEINENRLNQ